VIEAARFGSPARNEGFRRLRDRQPGIEFVQFLDGDCILLPGWIDAGSRALSAQSAGGGLGHLLKA